MNQLPHLTMTHSPDEAVGDEALCKALEAWQTAPWAAAAILKAELLTRRVLDPCVGTGTLAEAATAERYEVFSTDIQNWGYPGQDADADFLAPDYALPPGWAGDDFTVFMNPPFSKACAFVDKARELGARKTICFQRYAFYEGGDRSGRKQWWRENQPARIWVCGDRASPRVFCKSWEEVKAGVAYPHAWFVWERHHGGGAMGRQIYKEFLS